MKKYIKVSFSLMLALLMLAAMTFGVSAAGTDARDGLEVTLLTDQGVYEAGENINLTISIKNTNILDKRYYLYSLKTKALMKDAGRTGQDEYGIQRITNQWLGGEQAVTEYVYVVITDDTQTDTSKEVLYAGM